MAKSDNRVRKCDKIWEKIFDDYPVFSDIKSKGYFSITSDEINSYKGARARLLTKFDYTDSLPYIFQDNSLNILPVTRGTYVISTFKAYHKLRIDNQIKPVKYKIPDWIQTIDYNNLTSEAKALNCAYVSGMIKDVAEEVELKFTINGRMSSSTFNFFINNSIDSNKKLQFKNRNSQCQIDGGYEGLNRVLLIEAKNSISKDFIIRQLYYPYRLWNNNLQGFKEIVPVFFIYSSGVFHFLIYKFTDLLDYNSLELIMQKSYIIEEEPITLQDIIEIMKSIEIVDEPKIPFPQADRFERVIDLFETLSENSLSVEGISLHYDFDYRQAQYYSRACMYLGLAINNKGFIEISKHGKNVMKKKKRERYLYITKLILQHKPFYELLELYLKKHGSVTKHEIYQKIMKKNKKILYKTGGGVLSDDTLRRRASSIRGWIDWILDLQNKV
ncbi:MAG: type II restriction enzyme [bacterium]